VRRTPNSRDAGRKATPRHPLRSARREFETWIYMEFDWSALGLIAAEAAGIEGQADAE
jgi:hypothetical protein